MSATSKKYNKDDIRSINNLMIEEAMRRLATMSFPDFLKYINRNDTDFIYADHIKLLAETLDRAEKGELKKIAIFMPPQHGKSRTVTETFPAYYMMKNLGKNVMLASYGTDTASKFGLANLEKVIEFGDLFDVVLSKHSRSQTKFALDGGGRLFSTTIRGGATGFDTDLLIIDDPIKGVEDLTEGERAKLLTHYQTKFKTRLPAEDGIEIMILTRWHEDDLAANAVNHRWHVVDIPCMSLGEGDVLGRPAGKFLFEEIGKGQTWYEEVLEDIGQKAWESMYQQKPRVDDGIYVLRDDIQYYNKVEFDIENFDNVYQTWDFAQKAHEKADYTVGQVWGELEGKLYLIDMIRGQWDPKGVLNKFREFNEDYGDLTDYILVEDTASGTTVISEFSSVFDNLIPINPKGSKDLRVQRAGDWFSRGKIYLPVGENFTIVLVDEALGYKSVKNDDAIDACAQLVVHLNDKMRERKNKVYRKSGVAVSAGSGNVRRSSSLGNVASKRNVFNRR